MTKGPVRDALVSACYKEVEHVGSLATVGKLHCWSGWGKGKFLKINHTIEV